MYPWQLYVSSVLVETLGGLCFFIFSLCHRSRESTQCTPCVRWQSAKPFRIPPPARTEAKVRRAFGQSLNGCNARMRRRMPFSFWNHQLLVGVPYFSDRLVSRDGAVGELNGRGNAEEQSTIEHLPCDTHATTIPLYFWSLSLNLIRHCSNPCQG